LLACPITIGEPEESGAFPALAKINGFFRSRLPENLSKFVAFMGKSGKPGRIHVKLQGGLLPESKV
jgi:hypothetical protein